MVETAVEIPEKPWQNTLDKQTEGRNKNDVAKAYKASTHEIHLEGSFVRRYKESGA